MVKEPRISTFYDYQRYKLASKPVFFDRFFFEPFGGSRRRLRISRALTRFMRYKGYSLGFIEEQIRYSLFRFKSFDFFSSLHYYNYSSKFRFQSVIRGKFFASIADDSVFSVFSNYMFIANFPPSSSFSASVSYAYGLKHTAFNRPIVRRTIGSVTNNGSIFFSSSTNFKFGFFDRASYFFSNQYAWFFFLDEINSAKLSTRFKRFGQIGKRRPLDRVVFEDDLTIWKSPYYHKPINNSRVFMRLIYPQILYDVPMDSVTARFYSFLRTKSFSTFRFKRRRTFLSKLPVSSRLTRVGRRIPFNIVKRTERYTKKRPLAIAFNIDPRWSYHSYPRQTNDFNEFYARHGDNFSMNWMPFNAKTYSAFVFRYYPVYFQQGHWFFKHVRVTRQHNYKVVADRDSHVILRIHKMVPSLFFFNSTRAIFKRVLLFLEIFPRVAAFDRFRFYFWDLIFSRKSYQLYLEFSAHLKAFFYRRYNDWFNPQRKHRYFASRSAGLFFNYYYTFEVFLLFLYTSLVFFFVFFESLAYIISSVSTSYLCGSITHVIWFEFGLTFYSFMCDYSYFFLSPLFFWL